MNENEEKVTPFKVGEEVVTNSNDNMKTGLQLITEKRLKQPSKGWTAEHDREHDSGELAIVAATLAVKHTSARTVGVNVLCSGANPWDLENKENTIDRLAIAGALIAAEIDRLQSL